MATQKEIVDHIAKLTPSQKDDLLKYSFADIHYNCDIESAADIEEYLNNDGKDNFNELEEKPEESEAT
jgi:hypothetical protein